MNSTKFQTKFCKDNKDDEKIYQRREAVSNVLDQCTTDIQDILIAFNRLTNRKVLKCIHNRIACTETNVFNQFYDDGNIMIDTNNAGGFVDFVFQNKTLVLADSKLMSDGGKTFLSNFKTFADFARKRFDLEQSFKGTPEVRKESSIAREPVKEKKPLLWGRVDPNTYERIYNKRKLEYLQQRKTIQNFFYTQLKYMNRRMINDALSQVEKVPLMIETEKQKFEVFKTQTLEELEKAKELFEEKYKFVVKEEEELRKDREKVENSLFIIIDR